MDITRSAIVNDRVTWMLLLAIVVGGVLAYFNLSRDKAPPFVVRTAVVMTYFPGASPERVEQLISDKLEEALQEMPEVDSITSTSKTGVSIVVVAVKADHTVMRPIWDDLRRKVAAVKLPEGVIGPQVDDALGDVYGMVLTITGDGFDDATLKDVADEVRDEILSLDDVASVNLYGKQEERIHIEYSNARLARAGLSPMALMQILASQNIINPGGEVFTAREKIAIEPTGSFESIEDLRRAVIQVPGSRQLMALEDIVTVRRGYRDPPRTKVRASGHPAIGLGVSMRRGGNLTKLGDRVREVVDRLESQYPVGIEFSVQYFLPDHVNELVDGFVENLIQAVLVVMAVMLLTLGLRTGVVVAALIPMAILFAFVIMGAMGVGLNQVSLAALIIALGMLVDNAIVMSESIIVQRRRGRSAMDAAVDAAKELKLPLLVSSLTTIAAFLPVYLANSQVGEFMSSLFLVITITLLASWLLAITMTPMLCVLFLKVKDRSAAEQEREFESRWYRWYRKGILLMLRNRALTLAVTAGVFALSVWAFSFVPKMFFPQETSSFFTGKVTLPTGTSIARTEEVVAALDEFVAEQLQVSAERTEGVTRWAAFIGGSEPTFALGYQAGRASPEYAMLMFSCSSAEAALAAMAKLRAHATEALPEADAQFDMLSAGPPGGKPIEVRLSSRDDTLLFELVDEVKRRLRQRPDTRNVADNWGRWTKKLVVDVDEDRVRKAGLTNQYVELAMQSAFSGVTGTE